MWCCMAERIVLQRRFNIVGAARLFVLFIDKGSSIIVNI